MAFALGSWARARANARARVLPRPMPIRGWLSLAGWRVRRGRPSQPASHSRPGKKLGRAGLGQRVQLCTGIACAFEGTPTRHPQVLTLLRGSLTAPAAAPPRPTCPRAAAWSRAQRARRAGRPRWACGGRGGAPRRASAAPPGRATAPPLPRPATHARAGAQGSRGSGPRAGCVGVAAAARLGSTCHVGGRDAEAGRAPRVELAVGEDDTRAGGGDVAPTVRHVGRGGAGTHAVGGRAPAGAGARVWAGAPGGPGGRRTSPRSGSRSSSWARRRSRAAAASSSPRPRMAAVCRRSAGTTTRRAAGRAGWPRSSTRRRGRRSRRRRATGRGWEAARQRRPAGRAGQRRPRRCCRSGGSSLRQGWRAARGCRSWPRTGSRAARM